MVLKNQLNSLLLNDYFLFIYYRIIFKKYSQNASLEGLHNITR